MYSSRVESRKNNTNLPHFHRPLWRWLRKFKKFTRRDFYEGSPVLSKIKQNVFSAFNIVYQITCYKLWVKSLYEMWLTATINLSVWNSRSIFSPAMQKEGLYTYRQKAHVQSATNHTFYVRRQHWTVGSKGIHGYLHAARSTHIFTMCILPICTTQTANCKQDNKVSFAH